MDAFYKSPHFFAIMEMFHLGGFSGYPLNSSPVVKTTGCGVSLLSGALTGIK
jgi:hypothetical protein